MLSDFEPCSFQQNGLGVEEFQRDTPAYSELVFVLFDDVTLPHDRTFTIEKYGSFSDNCDPGMLGL